MVFLRVPQYNSCETGCMAIEEDSTTALSKQTSSDSSSEEDPRDKINKRLLPSKVFYFFFFSALGSVLPYISLFFKQLELSPKQTGLLVGIRPFVHTIAAPLWGLFADKTNTHRVTLLLGTIGWLFTYSSILFVHTEKPEASCRVDQPHGFNISTVNSSILKEAATITSSGKKILINGTQYLASNFSHRTIAKDLREGEASGMFSRPFLSNTSLWPTSPLNYSIHNHSSAPGFVKEDKASSSIDLFTFLFLLITLGTFFATPARTMANLATLKNLSEKVNEFGKQRLFGSIGWGLTAFIEGLSVGFVVARCGGKAIINYKPCFYVFCVMMTFAFIAATCMKFDNDADYGTQKRNLVMTSIRQHIDVVYIYLLLTSIYCGFALGLIETFLFWHLHDLGGSQILFSIITGVNSIAEMIGFLFSHNFIERFGHLNVIVVGLLSSAVQMLCYGLAKNPWIVLSVEALKSVAVSCTWAALLSYIGIRQGSAATMQAILHGLYWGLGYASGGMIGGILIHSFSAANVFLGMTFVAAFDALFLVLIIKWKGVGLEKDNYQSIQETSDAE